MYKLAIACPFDHHRPNANNNRPTVLNDIIYDAVLQKRQTSSAVCQIAILCNETFI